MSNILDAELSTQLKIESTTQNSQNLFIDPIVDTVYKTPSGSFVKLLAVCEPRVINDETLHVYKVRVLKAPAAPHLDDEIVVVGVYEQGCVILLHRDMAPAA